VNWSPSSHEPVISGFPVDEFRKDAGARFDIETERSLISKDDFDGVVVARDRELGFGNDLAVCLRKSENALVGFLGFDTLKDSHESPFSER
jgi:hypothetical protein